MSNSRKDTIATFVGRSGRYYQRQFSKIDDAAGFAWTFNKMAALIGPVWWCARHLWLYFWLFLMLETIAVVQICRGLFADLGREEFDRAQRLADFAVRRQQEAAEAITTGADNAAVLQESANALETASSQALAQAEQIAAQGPKLIMIGIGLLLLAKGIQGLIAHQSLNCL